MAANRVLLRLTEAELSMIVNNLKPEKPCTDEKRWDDFRATLLFNDLDKILTEMKVKAKQIEEYVANGNGKSIIKDEEHTTNAAKLYHGPLYCEKCE